MPTESNGASGPANAAEFQQIMASLMRPLPSWQSILLQPQSPSEPPPSQRSLRVPITLSTLSQEGSTMPRLQDDLLALRNAAQHASSLSSSTTTHALSRVLPRRFDYVRSPLSRARLAARHTDVVDALRSAVLELHHAGISRLPSLEAMRIASTGSVPQARARETQEAALYELANVRKKLTPLMVSAVLWSITREAIRIGAMRISTMHTVGYDTYCGQSSILGARNATQVAAPIPSAATMAWPSAAERVQAFEEEFPPVMYTAQVRVPRTVWPNHQTTAPVCASCGQSSPVARNPNGAHRTDGGLVCASCAETALGPCTSCGDQTITSATVGVSRSTMANVTMADVVVSQTRVCARCLSAHFEAIRHPDEGIIHVPRHMRSRLVIPTIQSYSYQPAYRLHTAQHEQVKSDTLFFGLELECGFGANTAGRNSTWFLSQIANTSSYFKSDSSVSNGVEIVTHPFTFRHWKETAAKEWEQRLETMRRIGMRSYNWPNCGIHIHMSLAAFTTAHIKRLLDLVYMHPDFFSRLSQRTAFDYCRLLDPDRQTDKHRRYRAALSVGVQRHRDRGYAARLTAGGIANGQTTTSDRRTAVNFPANKPTVEIRLFRGTLHYPSFAKNVELCHALHAYTQLPSSGRELEALPEFVRYIYGSEKQYPNLAAFIDRWYKSYRPVAKPVAPQYVVVRPPTEFEETNALVAANS